MKIKFDGAEIVKFREIEVGETFILGIQIYMKTRDFGFPSSDTPLVNTVNMMEGTLKCLDGNVEVLKIKGTFVVKTGRNENE